MKIDLAIPDVPATAIVYAESLNDRDRLRCELEENGFNAVCFEKEASCIDNFKALRPQIVIARTDASEVGWRFVFAHYLLQMVNPLVFVSNTLNMNCNGNYPIGMPVYVFPSEKNNPERLKALHGIMRNRPATRPENGFSPLLGESEAIRNIRAMLPNLANSKEPVVISGEKGVGKEHVARHIAGLSAEVPFLIRVQCDALQLDKPIHHWMIEIVESAPRQKPVIIIFNNINLLGKDIQGDLLLFFEYIEDKSFGDGAEGEKCIRIIATTEENLDTLVERGVFRKDLYFRINVIPLAIPPLRCRKSDIPILMDYYAIDACLRNKRCTMLPSGQTREMTSLYDWPGNVDELKRYMDQIAITGDESILLANHRLMSSNPITGNHLLEAASLAAMPQSSEIEVLIGKKNNLELKGISREFVIRTERRFMKKALELTNWNRKKAAKMLNISYKSMLNKMKAYDII